MRVYNLIYIRWMASMSRLDHDIGSHMATCHRLDRYLTINRRRRHAIRRIIHARPQIACRPTLALCNSWQVFVLRPFRFCVAASQQSRWIYRLLLAALALDQVGLFFFLRKLPQLFHTHTDTHKHTHTHAHQPQNIKK